MDIFCSVANLPGGMTDSLQSSHLSKILHLQYYVSVERGLVRLHFSFTSSGYDGVSDCFILREVKLFHPSIPDSEEKTCEQMMS